MLLVLVWIVYWSQNQGLYRLLDFGFSLLWRILDQMKCFYFDCAKYRSFFSMCFDLLFWHKNCNFCFSLKMWALFSSDISIPTFVAVLWDIGFVIRRSSRNCLNFLEVEHSEKFRFSAEDSKKVPSLGKM